MIEKKQGDFREVTIFFADKMHWVTAYLEKGEKVTITGDADYPAMLRVKGGRINDRLSTIRKEMAPLLKEQADLIRQLNKKNRENLNSSIEEADMASRLANVNHLLSEEAAAAIKKYPDEEASVVLIQHYFNHPDDTRQMDELLAVLNPKLNDFLSGAEVAGIQHEGKKDCFRRRSTRFQCEEYLRDSCQSGFFSEEIFTACVYGSLV